MSNIYFELTEAFNATQPIALLASGQAAVYYRVAIMSKDGDWVIRETSEACETVLEEMESRGACASQRAVARLAASGADRHAVVVAMAEEVDGLQQADRRRMATYEATARPYVDACRALGGSTTPLRVAHARLVDLAERLLPVAPLLGDPNADAQ